MWSKIKALRKNLAMVGTELHHHRQKADDIYAMSVLQPLLISYPYLPFNGGALRPICLAYILNEIVINRRGTILEFGSGLSTILMARLIKKNGIAASIISVEHDLQWAQTITRLLAEEQLGDFVTVVPAELKNIESPVGAVKWYDTNAVMQAIDGRNFDLVIVDGPPAYTPELRNSRFPVVEIIKNNLAFDYCLLLDDINRAGETEMAQYFHQQNPQLLYTKVSQTLGVFRTALKFNPVPFQY